MTGIATFVFTLASQRENDEAGEFTSFDAGDARAREIYDTGERYNHLAWGFGISTVLLLGTGATLWALDTPADGSVSVGLGFPGLRYQGRF